MTYLYLALEFFKTGLFSIGGGLATLPYLIRMSETHPDWFTLDELMNMIAVSESTPGPIGINMASFAGFEVGGVLGAIIASLSLVLPSFIIILIVVRILDKFSGNRVVLGVMEGLRPAVTGLIAAAGFSVFTLSVFPGGQVKWLPLLLFAVFLTATQIGKLKKIHPIVYIAIGAIFGVIFKL